MSARQNSYSEDTVRKELLQNVCVCSNGADTTKRMHYEDICICTSAYRQNNDTLTLIRDSRHVEMLPRRPAAYEIEVKKNCT